MTTDQREQDEAPHTGWPCWKCDDGEGYSAFPYYGVAPHQHIGPIIGSTVIAPKETWPANFVEDPEAPGCGTYTHCLACGCGKKLVEVGNG